MNKNVNFTCRLSENEAAAFDRWASEMEMNRSDYFRLMIRMKMAQEKERKKNEDEKSSIINFV